MESNAYWPNTGGEDVAVLPGDQPGTALRVRADAAETGCVRLEQMAFSPTLGWYTQKTFSVPQAMLDGLIRSLKQADCLMPRSHFAQADEIGPMRFPGPEAADPDGAETADSSG